MFVFFLQAYADFCADGRPFLRARINDDLLDAIQFYAECAPEAASAEALHGGTPSALPLAQIGQLAGEQQGGAHKLQALLVRLFNASEEVWKIVFLCIVEWHSNIKCIFCVKLWPNEYGQKVWPKECAQNYFAHNIFQ